MKLKAAYDNFDAESDATGLECKDPSKAQQHEYDSTDINKIVARYTQTGELPQHNMPPLEEDFSEVTDMQTALNLIVEARMAFMEQPADVRAKFDNDPAKFVDFCSNDANYEDMRKMGLLNQEAVNRHIQEQNKLLQQAEKDRQDADAFRKGQNGPKS